LSGHGIHAFHFCPAGASARAADGALAFLPLQIENRIFSTTITRTMGDEPAPDPDPALGQILAERAEIGRRAREFQRLDLPARAATT
jgi:hypothetical protein